MTDKHLFVLAAAVSLGCLISLIWRPENKSTLWRYTMFGAFAGYAFTAMLAWLNQYATTTLYPFYWFGYTTLGMVWLVGLNYFLALRGPVEVPDEIVDQLMQQTDAESVIERYRLGMVADRQRRLRTGSWVVVAGLAFIGAAFSIIHSFGLAEDMNGQQESFSKIIVRLISEVRTMNVKVDTLVAAGARRESRITALETAARKKARHDSMVDARVLENQTKMMSNQSRALRILKPKAVPQPVQPIKPRRSWWQIGYRAELDSLTLARYP